MTATLTTFTPERILTDAASLIETEGWAQGSYKSVDGCRCAIGALAAAAESSPDFGKTDEFIAAEQFLIDAIGWQTADGLREVVAWNDDDDRTQQEVIDAMLRAANNARLAAVKAQ